VQIVTYIGLGSNLGDREHNLLRAVAEIGKIPNSKVTALSSFYETSPVGTVKQPAFYNAVIKLITVLDARSLLSKLLYIENDVFKRIRTIDKGPRKIDLDLLVYGNMVIDEEDLIVPHPRLIERRFVLLPFSEIAPDFLHPHYAKTINELLIQLESNETVIKL
jgi:2-amino-4-hydroxy-6-hydroxymethyldihydropteridine diphosphokinase